MPCKYSSNRLPALILASICLLLSFCCTFVLIKRIPIARGKAINMAIAIRQSIQSKVKKANIGITNAPINCGK